MPRLVRDQCDRHTDEQADLDTPALGQCDEGGGGWYTGHVGDGADDQQMEVGGETPAVCQCGAESRWVGCHSHAHADSDDSANTYHTAQITVQTFLTFYIFWGPLSALPLVYLYNSLYRGLSPVFRAAVLAPVSGGALSLYK